MLGFGSLEAYDGFMIGPAMKTPKSLIAASTCKNALTLSMAFYTPATSIEEMQAFLDGMALELVNHIR